MRHVTGAVSAAVLLMSSLSWAAAPEPANDEQKTLYALGAAISQSLTPFTLNESELEFVKAGLADGVLKRPQKVDLQVYGPKIQQMQQVRSNALADVEKKAGAAFLAKAAAESGAKKTESGAIVTMIKEGKGAGFGFNAGTGEYTDLVKAGIIDAALVVKTSLTNAASVAGLMLTTDVVIAELKDDTAAVEGAVS